MKKTLSMVALMLVASVAAFAQSKVYLTREITPNAQGACPPVHVKKAIETLFVKE